MFLRILPAIISSVLLAAHFLRDRNFIITIICLAVPFLLLVKKQVVLTIVQGFLYLGVLVWGFTTYQLVAERLALGVPWLRMFFILLAVGGFTLFSVFMLNLKSVREKYLA